MITSPAPKKKEHSRLQKFYGDLKESDGLQGLPDDFSTFKDSLGDRASRKAFYDSLSNSDSVTGIPKNFDRLNSLWDRGGLEGNDSEYNVEKTRPDEVGPDDGGPGDSGPGDGDPGDEDYQLKVQTTDGTNFTFGDTEVRGAYDRLEESGDHPDLADYIPWRENLSTEEGFNKYTGAVNGLLRDAQYRLGYDKLKKRYGNSFDVKFDGYKSGITGDDEAKKNLYKKINVAETTQKQRMFYDRLKQSEAVKGLPTFARFKSAMEDPDVRDAVYGKLAENRAIQGLPDSPENFNNWWLGRDQQELAKDPDYSGIEGKGAFLKEIGTGLVQSGHMAASTISTAVGNLIQSSGRANAQTMPMLMLGEEVKQFGELAKEASPEGEGTGVESAARFTGSLLPAAVAIAAAPFTGATSAAAVPSILVSSYYGLTGKGQAEQAYTKYKEDKGEEVDPAVRQLIGVGTGAIYGVGGHLGIGRMLYGNAGKKLLEKAGISQGLKNVLGKEGMKTAEKRTANILTKFAQKYPNKAARFTKEAAKASSRGGATLAGINIGSDILTLAYQENADRWQTLAGIPKHAAEGAALGVFMGLAATPTAFRAKEQATGARRAKQGRVVVFKNKADGKPYEFLGYGKRGKTFGAEAMDASGKRTFVAEKNVDINQMASTTPEVFAKVMDAGGISKAIKKATGKEVSGKPGTEKVKMKDDIVIRNKRSTPAEPEKAEFTDVTGEGPASSGGAPRAGRQPSQPKPPTPESPSGGAPKTRGEPSQPRPTTTEAAPKTQSEPTAETAAKPTTETTPAESTEASESSGNIVKDTWNSITDKIKKLTGTDVQTGEGAEFIFDPEASTDVQKRQLKKERDRLYKQKNELDEAGEYVKIESERAAYQNAIDDIESLQKKVSPEDYPVETQPAEPAPAETSTPESTPEPTEPTEPAEPAEPAETTQPTQASPTTTPKPSTPTRTTAPLASIETTGGDLTPNEVQQRDELSRQIESGQIDTADLPPIKVIKGPDGALQMQGSRALRAAYQETDMGDVPIEIETAQKDTGDYPQQVKNKTYQGKVSKGDRETITLPTGDKVDVQYALAELAELQPSHDPFTFVMNQGFPKGPEGGTANQNDYNQKGAGQELTFEIGKDLDDRAFQNTPVYTPDKTAISGNGTTMGIKRAAKYKNAGWRDYQTDLPHQASKVGIDPKEIPKFDEPVLIRIDHTTSEYKVEDFQKYNAVGTKQRSPVQRAINISKTIKPDTIRRLVNVIQPGENTTVRQALDNDQNARAAIQVLQGANHIDQAEKARFYDPAHDGLTADGKNLIENVALGSVLNANSLRIRRNEGMRAVTNKIVHSLPALLESKRLGPEFDLSPIVNEAVSVQREIVSSGQPPQDIYSQTGMFGTGSFSPQGKFFNYLLHQGRSNFKKGVQIYTNSVAEGGGNMFDQAPRGRDQIISDLFDATVKAATPDQKATLSRIQKAGEPMKPFTQKPQEAPEGGKVVEEAGQVYGANKQQTLFKGPDGQKIDYVSTRQQGRPFADVPAAPRGATLPKEFWNVRRMEEPNKNWNFTTGKETLDNIGDVAYLLRALETASVEHSFMVGVKADGTPRVRFLSTGTINATLIDFRAVQNFAETGNFKKLYFAHNHPSANMEASRSDFATTKKVDQVTGDTPVETIIMDAHEGKFAHFKPPTGRGSRSETTVADRPTDQGESNKVTVGSFSKQVYADAVVAKDVMSPQKAAEFLTGARYSIGDKTTAIVLNTRNDVNAVLQVPDKGIEAITDYLTSAMSNFNSGKIILAGRNENINSPEAIEKINEALPIGHIADYVHVTTSKGNLEHYQSYRGRSKSNLGPLTEPQTSYQGAVREPDQPTQEGIELPSQGKVSDDKAPMIKKTDLVDPWEAHPGSSGWGDKLAKRAKVTSSNLKDLVDSIGDSPWSAPTMAPDISRMYLQNKMIPGVRIEQAGAEAAGGELPENLQFARNESLSSSRVRQYRVDVVNKMVKPIWDVIKNDLDWKTAKADDYLLARAAEEINIEVARKNDAMPDKGSGMWTREAVDILEETHNGADAEKAKELGRMWDNFMEFDRQLMLSSGLHSAKEIDRFKATYPHYLSTRGGIEEDGNATGISGDIAVRLYHPERLGRPDRARDEATHTILKVLEDIDNAVQNEWKNDLYRFVTQFPNPDMWTIDDAPSVRTTDSNGKAVTIPDPKYKTRLDVVEVYRDGQAHYIQFHSTAGKDLAKSINDTEQVWDGKFGTVWGNMMGYYSMAQTALNPPWILRNFTGDYLEAMVNLADTPIAHLRAEAGNPKAITKSIRALNQIAKGKSPSNEEYARLHEEAREFSLAGGKSSQAHYYGSVTKLQDHFNRLVDASDSVPLSPIEGIKKSAKWLLDTGEVYENGTRFNIYRVMRRNGFSKQESGHVSKNITLDFDKRGRWGKRMKRLYAFSNPAVQSGVRGGKVAASRAGRKFLGKIFWAFTLLGIYNRVMGGKDDLTGEYLYDQDVSDFGKENNLWIMSPDGSGNKVRMRTYGIAAPVKNTGDALAKLFLHYAWGQGQFDPGEQFGHIANSLLTNTLPTGQGDLTQTIVPTFGQPPVRMITNKNFFNDSIYPEKNPFTDTPRPDYKTHFRNVSPTSKNLTKGLYDMTTGDPSLPNKPGGYGDISPETTDYLAEFVTGGIGRFIGDLNTSQKMARGIDPFKTKDVPFLGTFVSGPNRWGIVKEYDGIINQYRYIMSDYEAFGEDGNKEAQQQTEQDYPTYFDHKQTVAKSLDTIKAWSESAYKKKALAEKLRQEATQIDTNGGPGAGKRIAAKKAKAEELADEVQELYDKQLKRQREIIGLFSGELTDAEVMGRQTMSAKDAEDVARAKQLLKDN